jgi:hypothetical protein
LLAAGLFIERPNVEFYKTGASPVSPGTGLSASIFFTRPNGQLKKDFRFYPLREDSHTINISPMMRYSTASRQTRHSA